MPWTETRPMQRLDFIRASIAGTEPFSALCRRFGISRKTGYKWLERFDPSDP
ncbi:helix-turn-helix domain-containing protein, partial [Kluyvera intermedia]|uniref:helix-turn-helix domain-containing protein n=1 Tax=Kluyvera intermedia TaxID=61648 RepID=UPI00372D132E